MKEETVRSAKWAMVYNNVRLYFEIPSGFTQGQDVWSLISVDHSTKPLKYGDHGVVEGPSVYSTAFRGFVSPNNCAASGTRSPILASLERWWLLSGWEEQDQQKQQKQKQQEQEQQQEQHQKHQYYGEDQQEMQQ